MLVSWASSRSSAQPPGICSAAAMVCITAAPRPGAMSASAGRIRQGRSALLSSAWPGALGHMSWAGQIYGRARLPRPAIGAATVSSGQLPCATPPPALPAPSPRRSIALTRSGSRLRRRMRPPRCLVPPLAWALVPFSFFPSACTPRRAMEARFLLRARDLPLLARARRLRVDFPSFFRAARAVGNDYGPTVAAQTARRRADETRSESWRPPQAWVQPTCRMTSRSLPVPHGRRAGTCAFAAVPPPALVMAVENHEGGKTERAIFEPRPAPPGCCRYWR